MSLILAAGTPPSSIISGYVGIVAGMFGVMALIGAAVAYFRASYARATIETLRDSNSALLERNHILEQENTDCQVDVKALRAENEHLRGYVAGTEAIERLSHTVESQHGEILDGIRDVKGLLGNQRRKAGQ